MKNKTQIYPLIFFCCIGILFGCTKKSILTLPIVTTSMVTEISDTSAKCGGTIISDGGTKIIARGVCDASRGICYADEAQNDIDSSGTGSFSITITGLDNNAPYDMVAYATNSVGTAYGKTTFFTTLSKPICGASDATSNSIILHGYVIPHNTLLTTVVFEYGTSTSYGEIVTATQSPIRATLDPMGGFNGDTVDAPLTGLTANTKYHFRIKASSSQGTILSKDLTFMTLNTSKANDIDGNIYCNHWLTNMDGRKSKGHKRL